MKYPFLALGVFISAIFAAPAFAQSSRLVTEEMMVKTGDPGMEIYVRNKRPADMGTFRPEQTVLYVHGATYPSETAFDLKLDDLSWMEYIASRGYDVWLLDLRGYGKSTRPSEMAEKPEANPPIVRGETAVKDIGAAVDFILQRRNIPRLNLLGWSWGTTLMATYTTQNAQKVERLVLYAPVWIRQTASLVQAGPGPLGAYRMVNREQAKQRWYTGVPEDKKAALIPARARACCPHASRVFHRGASSDRRRFSRGSAWPHRATAGRSHIRTGRAWQRLPRGKLRACDGPGHRRASLSRARM